MLKAPTAHISDMERFLATHVTQPDWRDACRRIVQDLGDIPSNWALGFLYASDTFAPQLTEILLYLRTQTGVRQWTGTVGSGICSTGHEEYDQPSLAVMVCGLDEDAFRIIPGTHEDFSDFLTESAEWRAAHDAYFCTVHGDPRNAATPRLIAQLAGELPGGFLTGGLTSSGGEYPQIADKLTDGGISGVLYAAETPVVTGLSQGCSLIGHRHTVTEAQRNIVVTIDDRPALDVFTEEIGDILARDLRRAGGYIFCARPVPGSDTGDYLVRNLVGIDPENKLLAIGDRVAAGDPIQFARRDAQTAREDLQRMLGDVQRRLPNPAKGAIYHTCLGRGRHLFGESSAELRIVQEGLGDVPLVGFYANGEISHNRLYGYTGVLTVFC